MTSFNSFSKTFSKEGKGGAAEYRKRSAPLHFERRGPWTRIMACSFANKPFKKKRREGKEDLQFF